MQPRNLALVGAALGAGFGVVGLIVPESLAALFGIPLDTTATGLVRLLCASYVGFAALNWAARDLGDGAAWRVVAVGNATSWAISGAVAAIAVASGLGNFGRPGRRGAPVRYDHCVAQRPCAEPPIWPWHK